MPSNVKHQNMEGKIYDTKQSGKIQIILYGGSRDVQARFLDTGYVVKTQLSSLLKGEPRDPNIKSKNGVGFIGEGPYKSRSCNKNTPEYDKWHKMFDRCYNKDIQETLPTYSDCSVEDQWHNFQEFAEWCQWQVGFMELDSRGAWQLDKDLMVKGNKIYGPEYCVFVPQEINTVLIKKEAARGNLPIGVQYSTSRERYKAVGSCIGYLGTYSTPEEAFTVYKTAKELHLKLLADKYKNSVDPRVYHALVNYQVEITD